MRNILLVVGATGLLGLFTACSGDDKPPIAGDGLAGRNTGGKNTGGKSAGGKNGGGTDSLGGAGGAGGAEDSASNPLAPTVIITSPTELTDPNEDGVLSGSEVTVNCSATQSTAVGSTKVNAAAVKIAIVNNADKVLEEKPGVPTANANEYSAKFVLTAVPSGVVSFTCKAEDTSKRSASDRVATFLDKGPIITIVKPAAGSAHPLSEPLDIEFTVEADPLSDTDTHASVVPDSVKLEIVGQPIDLSDASDKPGHYRLQVNLTDAKLFTPAPSGPVPLDIEAANERTPESVVATTTEDILVDGAGPAIKITSPGDKAVVGGKVKLKFEVTDAVSGVDQKTVVVALNMVDHHYDATSDAWSFDKNVYTFEFDSRQVEHAEVQITVNVGASDKVDNVSTGASELLYLDNYPPTLDLDPLNIRTITQAPNVKCSSSFDPVGNDAANDLDHVQIAGYFRSLVVDQTNSADEFKIPHFSGTNPASVRLYIEGDSAKPLLIDTDMDGTCDDVAEVDSTRSIGFNPIKKNGAPLYVKDDAAEPVFDAIVCPTKTEVPKPEPLCANKTSDMWQVIQDEYNNLPVIFGVSVTADLECTGVPWEFSGKLDADGWVCVATRGVDNAGNVGVSRPIHICLDDPKRAGTPACANSSEEPPSCTDGCTPASRLGGGLMLWK